jgi:hypothetical protein
VLSNNSVNENSAINTIVGTLSTIDANVGDTHTYTVQSGGSLFNISGNSLRTSQSFNYETASSHNVTIRSTDNIGLYFDKEFTINVNNVNEAPFALNLSNNSQQENTSVGTTIGSFTTSDVDSGDTFTYQLYDTATYPDNNSFTLTSGGILKNGVLFDFETKTSYTISVRTTDAGGLTYDGTFTINVTNQNESPTNINLSSSSISENVPTGTTIGTLSTTDPDSGDTFTYQLYDSITYPDNTNFIIDGTTLKSSAIFDFETKSSYSIRVRSTDAGGLTFDKTITITITNVTITVSASATTNVTCNGGSNGVITVSGVVGGTANYTYSKDGTNYQSSNVFSGLTVGSYTIYAKDSFNEVGSTSVSVTQPAVVTVSTSSVTYTTCYDGSNGSVTLSASGGSGTGYQFRRNSGSWQSSATFSSLGPVSHTFESKDGNECTSSSIVVDMTKTAPSATISQTNVTCNDGSDGSITASNPLGGNGGPYTVSIDGTNYFSFPKTFSNLTSSGIGYPYYSYLVYVKDSEGCVEEYSVTLTQPLIQVATISDAVNPPCGNPNGGSLTISSSGGVFPKTYVLSEDETSPYTTCGGPTVATYSGVTSGSPDRTVTSLTSGGFCLQVTDANGCVTNSGITVLTDPGPVLYRYSITRCTDNVSLLMTSPDFLPSLNIVKINDVCYQVNNFVETTCTQGQIHLTDGQYSLIWTSCNDCTSGGSGLIP